MGLRDPGRGRALAIRCLHTAAPVKRDIKIARATHLMHLEAMRYALYRESMSFLLGGARALVPRCDATR